MIGDDNEFGGDDFKEPNNDPGGGEDMDFKEPNNDPGSLREPNNEPGG
ncbi:MAG: hypothetical protein JO053_01970 [Acidobacteria bacterium]|nr:hypothetical protein [Acidobacteriota bacterium]